ncbi:MAG TPA: phosphoribosyltransferase family protein [Propionibacteriaceae bacterium]
MPTRVDRALIERLGSAAGDLLLGASCHGCGSPWWGVCPRCRADVAGRSPFVTAPQPTPAGFPLTVTSSPYDDVFRNVISAHKERQALILTRFLAERLALAGHSLLSAYAARTEIRAVTLVPVPSATAVVRQRGFDATWAMSKLAVRRLQAVHPVVAQRMLEQRRTIADQAGLTAAERAANLRQAFGLRRGSTAEQVVLVDDVVTTGASLTEATRVLETAGITVLGAITVAATARRTTPLSRA